MTARQRARVRMTMSAETTAAAHAELAADGPGEPLLDQLWLRSVLIEQRRRTAIAERARFDRRADGILARLADARDRCEDERVGRAAEDVRARYFDGDRTHLRKRS